MRIEKILRFQKRYIQTRSKCFVDKKIKDNVEQLVGLNSFTSLDWLLTDEIIGMKKYLKHLVETNHPVLYTMRDFMENRSFSFGAIVNLFSKVSSANIRKDLITGINARQEVLAKVTEMLRMSILFHKDIVTISEGNKHLHQGNKISILCGDYLLSRCLRDMATLKEQFYIEYMSSALRDLSLGQIVGLKDKNDLSFPSKPKRSIPVSTAGEFSSETFGYPEEEWIMRSTLNGGSLLARSCRSVLRMASFDDEMQKFGFYFGKYFALALRATEDLRDIVKNERFNLINLVLYLHLKKDPRLYEELERNKDDLKEVDYGFLIRELTEKGSLDDGLNFRDNLVDLTVNSLQVFDDSDAKKAMKDLIYSLKY